MSERTDSASANADGINRSRGRSDDGTTARQILLEEARETKNQQLAQINTIDTAAVRTVRIALLLLGLLVSGCHLSPILDLRVFGALGM